MNIWIGILLFVLVFLLGVALTADYNEPARRIAYDVCQSQPEGAMHATACVEFEDPWGQDELE